MNLTNLSSEERIESCLNCHYCYKVKNGIGITTSSVHMCLYGQEITYAIRRNQNGHMRQLVTSISKVTCEEVSKGTGRCKNLKKKRESA